MNTKWSRRTSWSEVCKRASGRRLFQAMRRHRQRQRRQGLHRTAFAYRITWGKRGFQSKLARALGVHRSTISRDMKALEYEKQRGFPGYNIIRQHVRWRRRDKILSARLKVSLWRQDCHKPPQKKAPPPLPPIGSEAWSDMMSAMLRR